MALILDARVKQKIATEAEWMADDTVLLEGEQAFVLSGDGYVRNFKIGDGTKTFVELPYSLDYTAFAAIAPQPLAPADPAPTTSGLYIPTVDGDYTNIGLTVDRSTGGADEGQYVQFINDNGTWMKVGTPLPQAENKIPDWEAGTYVQGDQRIHNGRIWSVDVASTTEEPGTGEDWVKKIGADAPKTYTTTDHIDASLQFHGRFQLAEGQGIGDVFDFTEGMGAGYGGGGIKVKKGDKFILEATLLSNVESFIVLDDDRVILDFYKGPTKGRFGDPVEILINEDGWLLVNTTQQGIDEPLDALRLIKKRDTSLLLSEAVQVLQENEKVRKLRGKTLLETIKHPDTQARKGFDFNGLSIGDKAPQESVSEGFNSFRCYKKAVFKGEVVVYASRARVGQAHIVISDSDYNILEIIPGGDILKEYVFEIKTDGFFYINIDYVVSGLPGKFKFEIYKEYTPYSVLVFSNSYSAMPLSYLQGLLDNTPQIDQREVRVMALNSQGAPLDSWLTTIRNDNGQGLSEFAGKLGRRDIPNGTQTIQRILQSGWDMITIHNQSVMSLDQQHIDDNLPIILEYCRKYNPIADCEYVWNLIHSSNATSGQDKWPELYQMAEYVKKTYGFDSINPGGTAMENLRQTSYIGDDNGLVWDGSHPQFGTPNYAICCAWFETLFAKRYNVTVVGNNLLVPGGEGTGIPLNMAVTEENKTVIQLCGRAAVQTPGKVQHWIQSEVEDYPFLDSDVYPIP